MNGQNNSGMGKIMLILAFVMTLGMMTLFFGNILDKQRNPNQQVISKTSSEGFPEVVLQQNRHGHYVATGAINGHSVDYLIDTGATNVAIPGKLAEKMNLKPGPEIRVQTANGTVMARLTRLDRVELGAITLKNVAATINPSMDENDEILLGMSFLRKLEMIQRGETLILRQYQYDE